MKGKTKMNENDIIKLKALRCISVPTLDACGDAIIEGGGGYYVTVKTKQGSMVYEISSKDNPLVDWDKITVSQDTFDVILLAAKEMAETQEMYLFGDVVFEGVIFKKGTCSLKQFHLDNSVSITFGRLDIKISSEEYEKHFHPFMEPQNVHDGAMKEGSEILLNTPKGTASYSIEGIEFLNEGTAYATLHLKML